MATSSAENAKDRKIYIAGHRGLIGSAFVRNLTTRGYRNIIGKSHDELELLHQGAVYNYLRAEKPDVVILAAALVGGIHANNTFRSEFIYNNLQIQNNLIWAAHELKISSLVFLGSSCIYPREAPQPMPESCLLSGPLEITNRPYALAKIAGLELVSSLRKQYGHNYFSVMPTNLYGPGDNFHPENSHVIPALIRRFCEAKIKDSPEVIVWGSGNPKREFMHVDDCADAIIHLLERVEKDSFTTTELARDGWSHINIGTGQEVSIREIAELIKEVVGYEGVLRFDSGKPDGTPRKLLDTVFLRSFDWTPKIGLREGLVETISWYQKEYLKSEVTRTPAFPVSEEPQQSPSHLDSGV